ncbi:MAG: crotonase/enoyl-CoA hydratase family protein [Sphingopyxis sp.]|nr:crotonase/enoyl-CoA hydratase family protein [Sphingopyxis sp.]
MTELIQRQLDGHIATLTINRPETRNAISDPDVLESLLAALDWIDSEQAVRVAILTGAGTAFSSGGNIKAIKSDIAYQGGAAGSRRFYRNTIQRLPERFERLEVPVIAAVNGPAYGVGCDLACMCDLRIASRSAVFAMSFVKLGLIPGDGGAFLLPRIVGHARASEMTLTGEALDAETSLSIGLVSKVVDDDALMPEAHRMAALIAQNSPVAVRLARQLLRKCHGASLPHTLELSANYQALAHASDDHKEAISAFVEKRPASFGGA